MGVESALREMEPHNRPGNNKNLLFQNVKDKSKISHGLSLCDLTYFTFNIMDEHFKS